MVVFSFSLNAALPPTTLSGQEQTTKPTTFNYVVPNFQATQTGGINSRVETGNDNELQNGSFEHGTVTQGWTISNATASANTTTQFEGKKSLSLALTGALSLSQSSTINAARKLGVQMVASLWVKSDDVSDLQLCSLKNGAEDKCTVTGGYVQGSGWRQLTVSFLGNSTSNGLKLKSTDTTGTVLVDQAFVGVGSPVVDFTPDMVYSFKVSATGVVSDENTDVVNGNCSIASTSIFTCPIASSVGLTNKFNCVANMGLGATNDGVLAQYDQANSTSSNMVFITQIAAGSGGAIARPFSVVCQKQGADYKTSKAYVASSSDTDWEACTFSTLAWQGLGTVSSSLQCARKGENLKIRGRLDLGTVSASQAQFLLPNNWGTITTASNLSANSAFGYYHRVVGSTAVFYTTLSQPSVGYFQTSNALISTAVNPFTPVNGNTAFANNDTIIFPEISIPIQGWQDSGVIVGSFEGLERCANAYECTDTFSAYISGTTVSNQNIPWISNCTSPTGTQRSCTLLGILKDGVNGLSSPMNCTASAKTGTGYTTSAFAVAPTTTTFNFNSGYSTIGETQDLMITCQKGTLDYTPKTAKIANQKEVNYTPGVDKVETFSFSYGTTNATTVCSASPCSYLDQIGNNVTSVTRSSTGLYTINFSKTFSKAKCIVSPVGQVVDNNGGQYTSCTNCSTLPFRSTAPATGSAGDSYGNIHCQGIPQ